MNTTVPDKNRPEWQQILTGEIEHDYKNYVLQTRIHQLRKDINYRTKTLDEAVTELYNLCAKYALAVQSDFKQIFKTW